MSSSPPNNTWNAPAELPDRDISREISACITKNGNQVVSVDNRDRIIRKNAIDGVPYNVVGHVNCKKILEFFNREFFSMGNNLKIIDIRDDVICSECVLTLRANMNMQLGSRWSR